MEDQNVQKSNTDTSSSRSNLVVQAVPKPNFTELVSDELRGHIAKEVGRWAALTIRYAGESLLVYMANKQMVEDGNEIEDEVIERNPTG